MHADAPFPFSRASANVVAKARAIRVRSDIPEHSIEHTYCTVCTAVSTPRDATGRGGTRCLLGMRGKGRRIAAVAPAMAMTRINLISFWIWSRLSSRRVPAFGSGPASVPVPVVRTAPHGNGAYGYTAALALSVPGGTA